MTKAPISLLASLVAGAAAVAMNAIVATMPGALNAAEIDHARRYDWCMTLAGDDPEEAFEAASAWRGLGGGDAARHCAAAALAGLGQYVEAAGRLETLARRARAGAGFRARLLAQAAQAWHMAGRDARAESALGAALTLSPDDVTLLVDRAAVRAARALYWEALDDLNRAIEIDPRRTDALAFRASAYRHLDSLDLAAEDARSALALDPADPGALLERGNIRRLRGDKEGARRDWLEVLRVAPQSPAAGAVRDNLEKMDVTRR